MSEILIGTNPTNPQVIGVLDTEEKLEQTEPMASQLPKMSTYFMLCAIPDIDKTYKSGIVKSDETMRLEEAMTTVLFVLKQGPDCYKDTSRFPSGPSCKEGDFILVKPHVGGRLKIFEREFRIINDDMCLAVVDDPRGYSRY